MHTTIKNESAAGMAVPTAQASAISLFYTCPTRTRNLSTIATDTDTANGTTSPSSSTRSREVAA